MLCKTCKHDIGREHNGTGCKHTGCNCKLNQTEAAKPAAANEGAQPIVVGGGSGGGRTADGGQHKRNRGAHAFWIIVSILLVLALYIAYAEARTNQIVFSNIVSQNVTTIESPQNITTTVVSGPPEQSPTIPTYILIWGFIGSAVYALKTSTLKIRSGKFENRNIPHLTIRLFIGPAIAVVIFFILITGGFFGLTIDLTKVRPLQLLPYVYAAIAFLSGYFVNDIISVLSSIVTALFRFKSQNEDTI